MTPDEFRAARKKLGLHNQADLARLMGMTQQSVSRLESGERQPTKQHAATMRLLLYIHKKGMLDDINADGKL